MRKRAFGVDAATRASSRRARERQCARPGALGKAGRAGWISVFGREVPGVSLLAMRGEGVVNAPILRVASVLSDTARSHEWVDSVAETRTLRKLSDSEYVQWNHVTTPWVLKDRDFVFTTQLELIPPPVRGPDYHSVTDTAAPKTSYIRGQFIYGKFVLTSLEGGKQTRVLAELLCDPKGSVAKKWMVNMVQKDCHNSTFQRPPPSGRKTGRDRQPELSERSSRRGTSSIEPCARARWLRARLCCAVSVSDFVVGVLARFGAAGRWRGLAAGRRPRSLAQLERVGGHRRAGGDRPRRASRHARPELGLVAWRTPEVTLRAVHWPYLAWKARTRSKRLFPAPGR